MLNGPQKPHNSFTEILSDFWDIFKQKYPSYANEYYDSIISKTISCGDPTFGYIEYGCMYCGSGRHLVAFTCKTKFCLRCGRVAAENFVKKVIHKLHPGVVYRHLILTIPEQLYPIFYKNRHSPDFYNAFYRSGWSFIKDVFCHVTKKKLKCGCLIVLHTAGRKGNYRPHLHIIVMNGGIDSITGRWVNIPYFPYENILPKKWQFHLLNMVKSFDSSSETKALVDSLWKTYKNGFVNFFMKGHVPGKSKNLIKYLSRYIFRPSISAKRIIGYDKKKGTVTYKYVDHKTKKMETEKVSVCEFIGRMVQQILPKRFHRSRCYGLQASKSYEKSREKIRKGMSSEQTNSKIGEEVFIAKPVNGSYEERMKIWTGVNPLECPECGHLMEIIKIWSSKFGVVFDLLDLYQKQSRDPPEELLNIRKIHATEPKDIPNLNFCNLEQMTFEF